MGDVGCGVVFFFFLSFSEWFRVLAGVLKLSPPSISSNRLPLHLLTAKFQKPVKKNRREKTPFGANVCSIMAALATAQPLSFPAPTVLESVMREVLIDGQLRPVIEVINGNLYELGRRLRETIFGQVNHAIKIHRTEEGVYSRVVPLQQFAIKIYFRARLQELQGHTQENPFQEIAAMQYVGNSHEHVMGQIECCSDRDNIYSVMDFSDGDELFDIVDRNGPLNEETAKRLFYQIVKGTPSFTPIQPLRDHNPICQQSSNLIYTILTFHDIHGYGSL